MDIKNLENYVEMKINYKKTITLDGRAIYIDGKRVALSELDGQTIVITEFEGGFYKLRDGNWELSWEQKDIDDWNTKHGLDKEQVEKIIDDSFLFDGTKFRRNFYKYETSRSRVSYKEQLDKYNSKKNNEEQV
tara:strand:+ start:46 stop:444 length:399 start_codon:yes stop_codon:yes gene_type:complete